MKSLLLTLPQPCIWKTLTNFLATMTQSVRQSRRKLFENEKEKGMCKDIRVFYALSVLQLCTGCVSNRCKCRKSMRVCGPGCQCVNCINKQCTHSDIDDDVNQLEDEGQMESWEEDEYIEESDEDMERNEEDEELDGIMEFVIGEEDD